jgi:hypothetical protein
MKIYRCIFGIFLITFFSAVMVKEAPAQEKITSALIRQDTSDAPSSRFDSLGIKGNIIESAPARQAKSGTLAMIFSAIIPGTGQIYAHRYYTIPLIWGFGGYFYSQWLKADNTYRSYRTRFRESVNADTVFHAGNPSLQSARDDWRNYRDSFAFYLVITYLLNIVDAYVGATLYDFDVSDNLGGTTRLRLSFPIR